MDFIMLCHSSADESHVCSVIQNAWPCRHLFFIFKGSFSSTSLYPKLLVSQKCPTVYRWIDWRVIGESCPTPSVLDRDSMLFAVWQILPSLLDFVIRLEHVKTL